MRFHRQLSIKIAIRGIIFLIFLSCISYIFSGSNLFVDRVVDGDTIVLSDGKKVRLIGVDTPETKHPNKPVEYFGKEATEFTRRMCEGKQVRLEYDQEKIDRYGRTLAYVFVLGGVHIPVKKTTCSGN